MPVELSQDHWSCGLYSFVNILLVAIHLCTNEFIIENQKRSHEMTVNSDDKSVPM